MVSFVNVLHEPITVLGTWAGWSFSKKRLYSCDRTLVIYTLCYLSMFTRYNRDGSPKTLQAFLESSNSELCFLFK